MWCGGCFGCGGVRHSFLTVFGEQPQSLAVARKVPRLVVGSERCP